MHKVHLLCLFAHGRFINHTLNSDTLLGAALSIVSDKNAYPPKRLDIGYLEKFIKWFSKKIELKHEHHDQDISLEQRIAEGFEMKKTNSNRDFVFMFVVLCRCLGMNVRLVLSLQPMSWKPSAEVLIKPSKKEEETSNSLKKEKEEMRDPSLPSCSQTSDSVESQARGKNKKGEKEHSREKGDPGVKDSKGKRGNKQKKCRQMISDDDDDSDFDPEHFQINKTAKSSVTQRCKNVDKRKSTAENQNESKRRASETDEGVVNKRKKAEPLLEWAEVYVEEEEKWVCIEITRGELHNIAKIEVSFVFSSVAEVYFPLFQYACCL